MAETAGADQHNGEEKKVIAGVDRYAGGQRSSIEPHAAKQDADANQEYKRSNRIARLLGVQAAKGMLVRTEATAMAEKDHWDGHSREGTARLASGLFGEPVVGRRERRQKKSAEEGFLEKRRKCDAEGKENPGRPGCEGSSQWEHWWPGISSPLTNARTKQTAAAATNACSGVKQLRRSIADRRTGSCARTAERSTYCRLR